MHDAEIDLCLRALMTLFAVEAPQIDQHLASKDYALALSELASAVNDSDAWYVGRQSAQCAAEVLAEWLDATQAWAAQSDEEPEDVSLIEIAQRELERIAMSGTS